MGETMTENDVITGDCLETLNRLPAGSRGPGLRRPAVQHRLRVRRVRRPPGQGRLPGLDREVARGRGAVLKPTGSFFLAIGDEYAAEHKVRLDALGPDAAQLDRLALHVRRELHQEVQPQPRPHLLLRPRPEATTRSTPTRCACPSARQTTYADRRANPVGKLPDDTWVLRPQETDEHFQPDSDTWYVSRVCGTFKERTGPPVPDAGGGAGADHPRGDRTPATWCSTRSPAAARRWRWRRRLGRRYLGIELSEEYADGVRERLRRSRSRSWMKLRTSEHSRGRVAEPGGRAEASTSSPLSRRLNQPRRSLSSLAATASAAPSHSAFLMRLGELAASLPPAWAMSGLPPPLAADHRRDLLHDVAGLQPFFTRSFVSAATSGTLPSSSAQPKTMNAEPAFWRMRSICVRTASIVVPAGQLADDELRAADRPAPPRAACPPRRRGRAAAALLQLLLELLHLLLKRLDAGRQLLRPAVEPAGELIDDGAARLHRRRTPRGRSRR